jgi:tripartite-type tricarboxylate transporter receptor subunit TctC
MRLFLSLFLSLFCFAAHAWPTKPVRIVVAYPPGGGIDVLARQLAEKLAPAWGQPVVVENKPGANTIVAADAVAKSDHHTILMTTDATFSINPHLYAKLPYDAQRDFIPVTMLVLLHQLLVAHPSLPANTLEELIKLAKAKPGAIAYASYGSGSQPHLAGEMLKNKAGVDLVHVPYKGISLAVPAVIAGEVQLTFAGIATSMPQLKSGRIKALATGGAALAATAAGADLRRARLSGSRDACLVRPLRPGRLARGGRGTNPPGYEQSDKRIGLSAKTAGRKRL